MPATMTADELREITGYVRARAQLRALHAAGFARARLGPHGGVILERAHYEAVCAGPTRPRLARGQRPSLGVVR